MSYQVPKIPTRHFQSFVNSISDLSGKTFVITGTTSGTGRVAAQTIAQKGGRVFMLNRSSSRATRVQNELSDKFGTEQVITIECDLQDFSSVKSAAVKLHEACENDGIYALINNAGIMAMPDEATGDGFDTQMQTNHLSHFLLTKEVFSLLEKGADVHGDARIVNHSSMARKSVKKLEAKYFERRGGSLGGNSASMLFRGGRWVRYGQTKLANAAFTAALHHRLRAKNSKVKALVAHPGWSNTELQVTTNKSGGLPSTNFISSVVARLFSQSEEDGTLGILSCAVLPNVECGEFYGPGMGMVGASKGDAFASSLEKQYDNPQQRDLLWNKSCEAIGDSFEI